MGTTPCEAGAAALVELIAARKAASAFAGGRGRELSTRLTALADRALCGLACGMPREGAAAVAVGGYGRRELGPASDLDVMVLRGRADPEPVVRAVLYPLWDAGLKVGHSVRTVQEAMAAAEARLETLTSLVDARFVAGDRDLFEEFERRFQRWLPLRRAGLAAELARREREREAAEPYPLQEPDLKEGRGMLRTAQGMVWLERADGPRLPAGFGERYEVLLAARNAMHVVSGQAENWLRAIYREPARAWLGAGEDWPRAVLAAGRYFALAARAQSAAKPRARRWWVPWQRERGAPPTAGARPAAREALPARGPELLALLARGEEARREVDRLALAGKADSLVEGLQAAWCLPQDPEYHRHALDTHLLRTVDELLAVTSEEGPVPFAAAVAEELGDIRPALLAALLHDIGKVDGEDHEVRGAVRAAAELRRLGCDERTLTVVVAAVREHLLLARTAQGRDHGDDDVIREVWSRAGDAETLRVLLLLSVADSRASSPATWSEWKGELLWELYNRLLLAWESARAGPGGQDSAVSGSMPASYERAFGPEERLCHHGLMDPAPGVYQARMAVRRGRADEVTVVAPDRPGLLALVAGAFTACGVNILSVQAFTRTDGVALEVLRTESAIGGRVEDARYERARCEIEAALRDRRGLEERVARKIRDYRSHGNGRAGGARVRVNLKASARYTVIEVRAPDRVGLLHTVAGALRDAGLDIHLARVNTEGPDAFDVFYVTYASGGKVVDDARLRGIERLVVSRLEGLLAG